MKNTTFRKKALLSSVAMLLVALVALGSATFAWFTQNPTVNAQGLVLEAETSAGLQILSYSESTYDTFATSTIINASAKDTASTVPVKLDRPVSLEDGTLNFWTTTAESEGNYARDVADLNNALGAIEEAEANYSENLYLRSSIDGADAVGVVSAKVTINGAAGEGADTKLLPAIRVTLVEPSNNSVIGTWSSDGTANFFLTETAVSSTTYTNAKTSGTAVTINKSVGYYTDIKDAGNNYVKMLVWLDGEDSECYTQNVNNLADIVSSIKVEFSTQAL